MTTLVREPALLDVADLKITIMGDEGDARILDHVCLSIRPGSILGLVGESGCGKSTTIKAVLGILPKGAKVEGGGIFFASENLLAMSQKHLAKNVRGSRITFIPQDPYMAFNPVFSVGSQLLEIMRWHGPAGPSHERRRAEKARHRKALLTLLRRVQIPDAEAALERYPHQFSGGQRQRLLIAAALSCSPQLVIADEPTTALDVTTQNEILLMVRELVTELNLAMLFVSHDLGVVARLCDDVTVMYAGQTVESGPTQSVLQTPKHPYTKALIACHPDRSEGFIGIPGTVPSPLNAPEGCRFMPRCAVGTQRCVHRKPALVPADADHLVNCIMFDADIVPSRWS